jgi:hypothetical protein
MQIDFEFLKINLYFYSFISGSAEKEIKNSVTLKSFRFLAR